MANVILFTIKGVSTGAVNAVEKLRASLGKIVKIGAVVGTALAAGFAFAVKSIIDVGSTTENLRIRLDALLGSTREGGKAFKQMAEFASTVPFSYEEIMQSATTLAGIVEGGADEIRGYMPVIADLATVSGLSIQQTTEQVQRMFSAGAGAADLFRERGINAMLGFESGVAVSAEETKKRLMEAFEDPASKFRGASKKMATTWDGVLSMIGDKWFNFKSQVADAGVFNYIKAIAIAIDQLMGEALTNVGTKAKDTSNAMISMFKSILVGVGFVADAFRGLQLVFAGLQLVFAKVAEHIITSWFKVFDSVRMLINLFPSFETVVLHIEGTFNTVMGTMLAGIFAVSEGFRKFANMSGLIDLEPMTGLENLVKESAARAVELEEKLAISTLGVNIEPLKTFEAIVTAAKNRSAELGIELETLALTPMPSVEVEDFQERINTVFENLRIKVEETSFAVAQTLTENFLLLSNSLLTEDELILKNHDKKLKDLEKHYSKKKISDSRYRTVKFKLDEELRQKQAEQNKLALEGSFQFGQAIRKREFIDALSHASAMLSSFKATNKTTFMLQKAASYAKAVVTLPSAVLQSFENGGGYPWGLIPAGLMLARGMSEIATISGTSFNAAHGGMTNVPNESTYLLKQGERVLSPNQNKDFTDFISNESGYGSSGGGVTVENLTIHVLENASNADALFEMDRSEIEELVAEKIIPALNSLDAQGVKMDSVSRGNI